MTTTLFKNLTSANLVMKQEVPTKNGSKYIALENELTLQLPTSVVKYQPNDYNGNGKFKLVLKTNEYSNLVDLLYTTIQNQITPFVYGQEDLNTLKINISSDEAGQINLNDKVKCIISTTGGYSIGGKFYLALYMKMFKVTEAAQPKEELTFEED